MKKFFHFNIFFVVLIIFSFIFSSCDESDIEHTVHDYNVTVVSPSCTEKGYTVYTCKICGYTFKDNYIEALGHDYCEEIVQPTCTKDGHTIHKCKNCEYIYKDNNVKALGHDISSEYCFDENGHYHVCKTCKNVIDYYLHNPDCVEATEEHGIHCVDCGYKIKDVILHVHKNNVTKVNEKDSTHFICGNIEYFICSCGKLFSDADCIQEILDKDLIYKPLNINGEIAKIYQFDYFDRITITEKGDCLFVISNEKVEEEIISSYSINNGVYCFDLTKTKFGNIFAVLEDDTFTYYEPDLEVLCFFNKDDYKLTFYEEDFVVYESNGNNVTLEYTLLDDEMNYIIDSCDFVLDILGEDKIIDFNNDKWSSFEN